MSAELKKCAHCGGEPKDGQHRLTGNVWIACQSCCARMEHSGPLELLAEQWNRRAPSLERAVREAMKMAANRWSEWGTRAEAVCEILEAALAEIEGKA